LIKVYKANLQFPKQEGWRLMEIVVLWRGKNQSTDIGRPWDLPNRTKRAKSIPAAIAVTAPVWMALTTSLDKTESVLFENDLLWARFNYKRVVAWVVWMMGY